MILLHGFSLRHPIAMWMSLPSWRRVAARDSIVPRLRGHGTARWHESIHATGGTAGAIGEDVIALMDALHIPEAVLAAGYDVGQPCRLRSGCNPSLALRRPGFR
ncbi:alpha/beta fold hydrolase [Cupriavidus basilensis]